MLQSLLQIHNYDYICSEIMNNMTARLFKYLILTTCMILITQAMSGIFSYHDIIEEETIYPTLISSSDSEFAIPTNTCISSTSRTITTVRRTSESGNSGYTLLKSGKLINRHNSLLYYINLDRFPFGFTKSQIHLVSLGKLII